MLAFLPQGEAAAELCGDARCDFFASASLWVFQPWPVYPHIGGGERHGQIACIFFAHADGARGEESGIGGVARAKIIDYMRRLYRLGPVALLL